MGNQTPLPRSRIAHSLRASWSRGAEPGAMRGPALGVSTWLAQPALVATLGFDPGVAPRTLRCGFQFQRRGPDRVFDRTYRSQVACRARSRQGAFLESLA